MPAWRVAPWPTALLALAVTGCADPRSARVLPPPGTLIAHGLGGIAGVTYSNSREAFELWYGRGRRWFEADLALTADRQLVCFHPGTEVLLGVEASVGSVTLERFMSWRVAGSYTPLSLHGLLGLLRERRDAFLLVDAGMLTPVVLGRLQEEIDRVDAGLRRRILVEFYRPDELSRLRGSEGRHGRFGAAVYATYQWTPPAEELLRFVATEHVPAVILGSASASRGLAERMHRAGTCVIVYTVNDPERARYWLSSGVDAVITDFLSTAGSAN